MQRIMKPLAEMGAQIRAREDKFPPLEIHGAKLRAIDYTLPVPSAQVKTCVLFAGLFAEGETSVTEPVRSRDHTEIALREFGAELTVGAGQDHARRPAAPHGARPGRALRPLFGRVLHRGRAAGARFAARRSAASGSIPRARRCSIS